MSARDFERTLVASAERLSEVPEGTGLSAA